MWADNAAPADCGSFLRNCFNNFSSGLRVGHFNAQSLRPSLRASKFDEIRALVAGSGLDVVGVSETWLKSYISSRAVEIPGYRLIRNDRVGGSLFILPPTLRQGSSLSQAIQILSTSWLRPEWAELRCWLV